MTKHICVICDKVATYTLQPAGGQVRYLCTKHFNETVKQLEKAA